MTIVTVCPICKKQHSIPYKNTQYFRCCGILHKISDNTIGKSAFSYTKSQKNLEKVEKKPENNNKNNGMEVDIVDRKNIKRRMGRISELEKVEIEFT